MEGEDQLVKWLNSYSFLPDFLKDYHEQKDLFKSIHYLLNLKKDYKKEKGFSYQVHPESWVDAHIYTISSFLWYMASCGYTLQKSRKKLDFQDICKFKEKYRDSLNGKQY